MNVLEKLKVAVSKDQLQARIKELGESINEFYGDKEYIVLTILKGSIFFLTDLTMYLSKKIIIDFMAVSSYYGVVKHPGNAKVVLDLNTNVRGKKILIVEDIIDTGDSLKRLLAILKLKEPESIEVVTLLRKKNTQKSLIEVKWIGFEIENKFVVGYGLDYKHNYRNIDYIGYLEV